MIRHVFDEPREARETPLAASEPVINWFLQSTRQDAAEGRRVVNDLYSRFPNDGGRMYAELHADEDRRLLSALDELLVHDLLARHYDVAYEEGDGTRPDFRLYRDGLYVGAVEVATLFLRDDWVSEQRRHALLTDELNKRLTLTTHSIEFEIRRWDNTNTPSMRQIGAWLRRTLETVRADPDALTFNEFGARERVFSASGADIAFQFWPLPDGYVVQDGDRVAVSQPPIGGWIDSAVRLRQRLNDKAVKYDVYGEPYAVAVSARDTFCDLGEIHEALTGTSAVVIPSGKGIRKGDGFFGNGRHRTQGKHQRVSAVFSIHEWFPGGPYRPRVTRFDNPFAAVPFPTDALPFGGHWGVVLRDSQHVKAGWLVPGEAHIPA